MKWTGERLRFAQQRRAEGATFPAIAAEMGEGFTAKTVQTRLVREKEQVQERAIWVARVDRTEVSAKAVLARDEAATLVPRDLTARLMGDPLPGHSQLEKREIKSPSIVSDPLDGLVYARIAIR